MTKTFMRYAGNKSRILKQILPLVPDEYNTYYEPFLGSGALFLALNPKKAVLNDLSPYVANIWKSIKTHPSKFFEIFDKLFVENIKGKKIKEIHYNFSKLYYIINKTQASTVYKSALYLFLTYYSFLGVIETKHGRYVKHGLRVLTNIKPPYTKETFCTVSSLLKNTKIHNKDYKDVIEKAKKKDFVYLDPPYIHDIKDPIVYNKKGEEDILISLKDQMDLLTSKGVYAMISNSDFPIVRKTFKDYNIHKIKVYRPFKKKYDTELVITNY